MLAIFLQKWKLIAYFARKYVTLRTIEAIVQIRGTPVAIDCWLAKSYTYYRIFFQNLYID